jgi:hypothetical protein
MTIIGVLLFFIVIGIILFFVRSRIDPTIYNIIIVILVIVFCCWLLAAFGLIHLPAALQIRGTS